MIVCQGFQTRKDLEVSEIYQQEDCKAKGSRTTANRKFRKVCLKELASVAFVR